MSNEFDYVRNQVIGTVEYVSPREIKILLDIYAPQNTAINTGQPTLFPKVNGFILIPNEAGALIGMISWIGIEYSRYPQRQGYKDYDLIDLPFPLRKLSLSPLGILKETKGTFEIERGVYSYPSVGDIAIIPDQDQLRAIVQNKDENARVKIGVSPLAANAPVFVNPDRVFGRHIAILGNTGSGKSCSVAGLVRWSLETAQKEIEDGKNCNARFIVLDPNGEYTNSFDGLCDIKKFQVKLGSESSVAEQLKVPVWMWNSYEWSSIAQASVRTQRPLLRRALRELRAGSDSSYSEEINSLRRYYSSCAIELMNDLHLGAPAFKGKPGKNDFGKKLKSISDDALKDSGEKYSVTVLNERLTKLANELLSLSNKKHKIFLNDKKEEIEYYDDFTKDEVVKSVAYIEGFLATIGGIIAYEGPDEDNPIYFKDEDFISHLERLSKESSASQFMDFF
jgi:hypothetical protein